MQSYYIISLVLMAFGFWQRKIWIFFIAGTSFVVDAIFAFQNNSSGTIGWGFGWIDILVALACILSPVWLGKRD